MATHGSIFKGKSVAEAIEKACKSLKVPQEQLDIEVLNTGSSGIFGLIRPKAMIKVTLKQETQVKESAGPSQPRGKKAGPKKDKSTAPPPPEPRPAKPAKEAEGAQAAGLPPEPAEKVQEQKSKEAEEEPAGRGIPPEVLAAVKTDISELLALMGFPSEVIVTGEAGSVLVHISGEHTEAIIGPEGRTLDNLQYLLRKMFSKKFSSRIALSLDAGDFKANRLKELKGMSLELAAEVKETGKTRSIASLNPSERRIVHMALQEDKEIRSRSVGDGLFKKVLIYRPGKGKKTGPRKRKNDKSAPGEVKINH